MNNRSRIHKKHARHPRITSLSQFIAVLFIFQVIFLGSSCNREISEQKRMAMPTDTPSIPITEEPIIALVGRSVGCAPSPDFVLYGNGLVIFGNHHQENLAYSSTQLSADQVRQIYSSVPIDSLSDWDGHTFTPATTFTASYYLFVRKGDGSYLRLAAYSLPPYGKWPIELRPPEIVGNVMASLAHYSAEGASEWIPPEVEVEFQEAVPSPEDVSWWPKNWSQPRFDRSSRSNVTVLRLAGSDVKELREYLRRYFLVRFSRSTYDLGVRYPFPHEEGIAAEVKKMSPICKLFNP